MRCDAGKEIVNPEEERDEQDQGQRRRHPHERLGEALGHPLDEPDVVQPRSKREQRGEIEEHLPGTLLGNDVGKLDNRRDQQQRDDDEYHHRRVDVVRPQDGQLDAWIRTGDPEEHRQEHQSRHHPFVA